MDERTPDIGHLVKPNVPTRFLPIFGRVLYNTLVFKLTDYMGSQWALFMRTLEEERDERIESGQSLLAAEWFQNHGKPSSNIFCRGARTSKVARPPDTMTP